MTRNQRLAAFAVGAFAIIALSSALIPKSTTPAVADTSVADELAAIRSAVDRCNIGFDNLAKAMAESGLRSLSDYTVAQRAEGLCGSAYNTIGGLRSTDTTTACQEEASSKRFVATRVQKFLDDPSPKHMSEIEMANEEVFRTSVACAAALDAAEKALPAQKGSSPAKAAE
jgi:hypothetical protein